eukprot:gb/GECG01001709.1/.p1 GENE.gb/GECG01001709.1/~~gb/GECG01001709.1/.p1  ORF type:complete len:116 (+),score=2.05 gb/GECG01001709.1/:1-348(+)
MYTSVVPGTSVEFDSTCIGDESVQMSFFESFLTSNAGKSVFRLYRTNVQCSDGCEVFVANQTNIGPHNFVGNLIISDIKTDRNNIWSSRANLVNHLCHLHCRRGSLTREEHPCFR